MKHILITLLGVLLLSACSDDEMAPGNPVMNPKTEISTAMFGDSLQFTVGVADGDVPLSTLKAQLFFGDEKVSETVIRTKTDGEYTGKVFVPYYANIPNASATLKLVLQNIHFTITEREYTLPLTRPDYEYLTLVSEEKDADGKNIEYRMQRTALYEYEVTDWFSQKVKAYIKTPAPTAQANEIIFGWQDGGIKEGATTPITFSNSNAGQYTIAFNSFNYDASPFIKLLVDGREMDMVDDNNYRLDLSLSTGQLIEITGIPGMDEWWIDPDYFEQDASGKLKFLPMGGSYRLTANFSYKYFIVEALSGGDFATLQADGSGALWIIGEGIGKPSYSSNHVGWTTEKALCMAPIAKGKYQITVTGGKTVNASGINFKFFHQKGWGGEYKNDALSTTGELVYVGDGTNGRDPGNLGIAEGKTLDVLGVYTFTVDVTAGIDKAVLTVAKVGEEEPVEVKAKFDGEEMQMVDPDNYKVEKEFVQGQSIAVAGIDGVESWWIDPDYFTADAGGRLTFLPISGKYRVTANMALKYFRVEAMSGDNLATLQPDGTGAIWIIGDNIGKPALTNTVGWDTSKGICMAPIGNKQYRVTLDGGVTVTPESINFKFFHQRDWGGEFSGDDLTTDSDIVFVGLGDDVNGRGHGNLGIVAGKALEEGKRYVFIVDVSQGNNKAVLTVTEQNN